MRTTTTNVLLIGVLAAGLLGCGSDNDTAGTPSADPSSNTATATSAPTSDEPPDPTASDAAATSEVTDAPALEPDFRWPLAGDGTADAGSVDLTTDGGATWSSDGLTLDGVTGYAASPDPGPIDTTKSFTVMAWVKPDGIVPFSTAVSQLGEVAGAFFLGYGENTWNFAIKPSDSNEPGVTRNGSGPGSSNPSRRHGSTSPACTTTTVAGPSCTSTDIRPRPRASRCRPVRGDGSPPHRQCPGPRRAD